jgi:hypothetical protein
MSVLLLALGFANAATPAPATPPAPTAATPATPTTAVPVDCANLAGDAKTKCENQIALNAAQLYLASLGDCAKLTGDPKALCDSKTKELNAQIAQLTAALAPAAPAKGAKAVRSDTNHLEAEDSDE